MASAGYTKLGGKRISVEGKSAPVMTSRMSMCQGCEENTATQYCHSCLDALCKACAKSHLKYFGKSHILTELSEQSLSKLVPKSGEENTEISNCVHHPGNEVTRLCKTCKLLVCGKCIKDRGHKGHAIETFGNATSLLVDICNSEVKLLLDDIRRIERVSSAYSVSTEPIRKAKEILKQKHSDLLQVINASFDNSITRLDKEQRRVDTETKDVAEAAKNNIEKMEFNVTKLNTSRKSKDVLSMVTEINLCDHTKVRVGQFLHSYRVDRTTTPFNVETLVPGLNEYDHLSQEVSSMFQAVIQNDQLSPRPTPRPKSTSSFKKDIGRLEFKRKSEYRKLRKNRTVTLKTSNVSSIAKSARNVSNNAHIIAYTQATPDISVVECGSGEVRNIKADCGLQHCLIVSDNQYVGLDNNSELHLFNKGFNTIYSMPAVQSVRGMCCLNENEFVVHTEQDSVPFNTFYIYQIGGNMMTVKKKLQISNDFSSGGTLACCGICPSMNNDKIILVYTAVFSLLDKQKQSMSELSIVDSTTGAVVRFRIPIGVRYGTPYIDEYGDLLVCSSDDKIHVYRAIESDTGHHEVLDNTKVDWSLKGIVKYGDKLVLGYIDRVECYSRK